MSLRAVDTIQVTRLHADGRIPTRSHGDDAGFDLYAVEGMTIPPTTRAMVSTGIAIALPQGYAGLVLPRSGTALRNGISIVNGPGLIDAGYRGEIRVLLLNTDRDAPFVIARGDRIAQLMPIALPAVGVVEVESLGDTDRSADGFGSTGR